MIASCLDGHSFMCALTSIRNDFAHPEAVYSAIQVAQSCHAWYIFRIRCALCRRHIQRRDNVAIGAASANLDHCRLYALCSHARLARTTYRRSISLRRSLLQHWCISFDLHLFIQFVTLHEPRIKARPLIRPSVLPRLRCWPLFRTD